MLTSVASETEQKVILNWSAGGAPSQEWLDMKFKEKLDYQSFNPITVTIAMTDLSTLNFDDFNVELNQDIYIQNSIT